MTPQSLSEWMAWAGVVLPLVALAASAVAFVASWIWDLRNRRRALLLELTSYLDDPSRPVATEVAAAYQPRQFTKHEPFVVRFRDAIQSQISGASAQILKNELRRTAEHLRVRP